MAAISVAVATLCGCEKPNLLAISAGVSNSTGHCLRVTNDARLLAAGNNHRGQLGLALGGVAAEFHEVLGLPPVASARAGTAYSVILAASGEVSAFGDNKWGQLAASEPSFTRIPLVVRLPELAVSIAAGGAHALALGTSGTLYGWGSNTEGQLGPKHPLVTRGPVLLASEVRDVAADLSRTAYLSSDGGVNVLGGSAQPQRHCCWPGSASIDFTDTAIVLASQNGRRVHEIELEATFPKLPSAPCARHPFQAS